MSNKNIPFDSVAAIRNDFVYITETLGNIKPIKTQGKDYVFEAIAARFGVLNENNRIYAKEDYLPHLQYLNEKIKRGRLVGELDHPAGFEISLQNVSHIIESLWYDDTDDTVKIRVRLLPQTPKGQIAKALVDAGIPLAISSRSAGQIIGESNVQLHRIFTYDLVGEPGFKDAILEPTISENLKANYQMISESLSAIKKNSILNNLNEISENYNFNDNIKIYKINEDNEEFFKQLEEVKNTNTSMYVTKKDFDEYTGLVQGSIGKITEQLKTIAGQLSIREGEETAPPAEVNTATAELPNAEDANIEGDETTELPDIEKDDDKEDIIKKLVAYVNYLASQMEALIGHDDYVAETLNKSINYAEHLGSTINSLANFVNYIGEKLNQGLNFSDMLAEKMNEAINHNDYIVQKLNESIDHGDHLAGKINQLIDFTDYIGEQADKHIDFSNYLVRMLNGTQLAAGGINPVNRKLGDNVTKLVEGKKENKEGNKVNENKNAGTGKKKLTEEVAELVSIIKNDSVEAVLEQKYPFLRLLSEENKQKFFGLGQKIKAEVVTALNLGVYTNESDVLSIMEGIMSDKTKDLPVYIKYMPAKYKETYEQMNESEKKVIANQAKTVKLTTPYQVKTFWDTRDLDGVTGRILSENKIKEAQESAAINESQSKEGYISAKTVHQHVRGYSDDYLSMISNGGARRK